MKKLSFEQMECIEGGVGFQVCWNTLNSVLAGTGYGSDTYNYLMGLINSGEIIINWDCIGSV